MNGLIMLGMSMYIINYHNIVADEDYDKFDKNIFTRTSVTAFKKEVDFLSKRFNFVTLKEIVTSLEKGKILPSTIAFTFDDGYQGVYNFALPILESYGVTGTILIIPKYSSKTHFHFDELEIAFRLSGKDNPKELKKIKNRLKNSPSVTGENNFSLILSKLRVSKNSIENYAAKHKKYFPMSWQEINDAFKRGHSIGSHTISHHSLKQMSHDKAIKEIVDSLKIIKRNVKGISWIPFSYPYGKPKHISNFLIQSVKKSGYACGLTTITGINMSGANLYKLKRVELENGKFI